MAPQAAESILQQSAAGQREPSMEEILASIRRIIEDSDAVRTSDDTVIPQAANAPSPALPPRTSEVDAFREELREEAPVIASPVKAVEPYAPDVVAPTLSAVRHDPLPADDVEPARAAEPAANVWTPAPPVAQRQVAPAEVETPKQSIISEVAGRQVAAAFGELSEAFAATRRRSFDEVAEEMMRPMLQDWLDNNLPTLVEKLVREEIERVARGAAR
jgi:cell pole-organizing protein PopZ